MVNVSLFMLSLCFLFASYSFSLFLCFSPSVPSSPSFLSPSFLSLLLPTLLPSFGWSVFPVYNVLSPVVNQPVGLTPH